jgi:hypothetical protein
MQGTIYGLDDIGFTVFLEVMSVIKFSYGDASVSGTRGRDVIAFTFGLRILLKWLSITHPWSLR